MDSLNDALANQDTPTIIVEGAISILTLVGVGLKVAGKQVPILDQLLGLLQKVAPMIKKKAPPAPSDPAKEPGLAAVIELKPKDKKDPL